MLLSQVLDVIVMLLHQLLLIEERPLFGVKVLLTKDEKRLL